MSPWVFHVHPEDLTPADAEEKVLCDLLTRHNLCACDSDRVAFARQIKVVLYELEQHRKVVSNIVDVHAPGANMYGCQPCPQCEGRYRYVLAAEILCPDCTFQEDAAKREPRKND